VHRRGGIEPPRRHGDLEDPLRRRARVGRQRRDRLVDIDDRAD